MQPLYISSTQCLLYLWMYSNLWVLPIVKLWKNFFTYFSVDAVQLHYKDITTLRTSPSVCIWGSPKQHHLCVHTDGQKYFIHAWLLTKVGSQYSCEFEPIERFTYSSSPAHLCDAFRTLLERLLQDVACCCQCGALSVLLHRQSMLSEQYVLKYFPLLQGICTYCLASVPECHGCCTQNH